MHNVANVIHHDIKPENILVDKADVAKITDFGVSIKLAPGESDELKRHDWGTKMYLPPESWASNLSLLEKQMFGKPLDVWSLGMTFFKMLFGKLPFGTGNHLKELEDRIVNEQ